MKLYGSQQMAEIDRKAIEDFGIPNILLMENAGTATLALLIEHCGDLRHSFVPIFVGPGNNGGDGLVIGRHLAGRGCTPVFFIFARESGLPEASFLSYSIARRWGLPVFFPEETSFMVDVCQQYLSRGLRPIALIDALFGVGLSRDIGDFYAEAVKFINTFDTLLNLPHHIPVLSCDIPSGVDADTGHILGTAVRADHTATYSFYKVGLLQNAGKDHSGKVEMLDIGIPSPISEQVSPLFIGLTKDTIAQKIALHPRPAQSHKGSFGHLALFVGSKGMAGAGLLAGKSALLSGTGLTSIAVPSSLSTVFESEIHEAMTCALGEDKAEYFTEADLGQALEICHTRTTVAMGPGIGTNPETVRFVCHFYTQLEKPMVVDADAINALAHHPDILMKAAGPRVFTPHPGEMARLLGVDSSWVQAHRREAVHNFLGLFAECAHEIVVLLKGSASLVASNKEKDIYLNPTGNAAMASGGMGDVLTGCIASLVAQGYSPLDGTLVACWLHGRTGDILVQERGIGFSAGDVADNLYRARKEVTKVAF